MGRKARPKTRVAPPPVGPTVRANLIRLGYGRPVVNATEVVRRIAASGRPMAKQQLLMLFNSVRVRPATIERIAAGLGVDPGELTRPVEGPGGAGS